ncbi:MBOAT family O-acyltransferase [Parabacteroides chinchillae]|uniref:D-alanyl-lipoteichoic acid acyltransferase DltB, MBOAT superfamily n=1 Tax=Parabacteroides chinchillae TaxID=871327 RepID=A0A8G2BVD2_9BACT|nr:MBOAT family O-acyltransferase [Parabacteroides chinchillae]SEF71435.1 D-alanyl-lipoteichoic acid acyltransferase DltB, MBOAT superfamily [Parabacteroides chinchillae]
MLFNSVEFSIYLPVVFLLYWFVFNRKVKLQNLFIVVVSYLFYGWWDWHFLILIVITSFCSWLSGVCIDKLRNGTSADTPEIRKKCKWVVGGNVALNLGILIFFKYFNFFVESFITSFSLLGINLESPLLYIILPVGISFYTFQALSYTIDVYRKKLEPTYDVVAFFAFVSFFPQLVAGPIERATNLLVQFYKPRNFTYPDAVNGMRQILWGFFKKIVIADNCAIVVNDVFGNYSNYSASTLLLGAIFFSFQIYGDFSGYSDIAIGTAKLFGITLKQNFNYPYFSRNIIDFWRRWHISLNTWFVDYVYIPLGGSWEGMYKHIRNIFIIFFLSGLWHGANWTFITWGIYHALLFIPLLLLSRRNNNKQTGFAKPVISMFITFLFVTVGWIIFRADTLSMAWNYISGLFSDSLFTIPKVSGSNNVTAIISLFFIFILLTVEWINRNKPFGLDLCNMPNLFVRYSFYSLIIASIYFFGADASNFIYFQF